MRNSLLTLARIATVLTVSTSRKLAHADASVCDTIVGGSWAMTPSAFEISSIGPLTPNPAVVPHCLPMCAGTLPSVYATNACVSPSSHSRAPPARAICTYATPMEASLSPIR